MTFTAAGRGGPAGARAAGCGGPVGAAVAGGLAAARGAEGRPAWRLRHAVAFFFFGELVIRI
uniref:Uncharacterized protein n=1 Tax=Oryza sativa subsp. japonica TaxID=39947 RepID=Q6K2Z8_ORYSJ|nr:hypothetical protein [Oryza sativa Japonica Group]BAD25707.1 hypothetical protein [Oryza sativa Japonica Group]